MDALSRARARVDAERARAGGLVRTARDRRPAIDHLARAYGRYQGQRGDRLAASVTYFGFLSFFPVIALAFVVVSYLAQVYPKVNAYLREAIESVLPGMYDQLHVTQIGQARAGVGVIGVVILLWSGIGWVDALREALRDMWLRDPGGGGNFVIKKMWSAVVLIALGVGLLASVAVSSLATSATSAALRLVGVEHAPGAGVGLRLLAIAIAVGFDTLGFLLVFIKLAQADQPRRHLLRGALLGAVGFETLKLVGTYLIGHTTSNPLYASFAVVVGLLIWINLVARFTLFAAAWTGTLLAAPPPEPDAVPIGVPEPRPASEAPSPAPPQQQPASARAAPAERKSPPRRRLAAVTRAWRHPR